MIRPTYMCYSLVILGQRDKVSRVLSPWSSNGMKKFEPWRPWEGSAKLAENEKFKDPENEDKCPWAYSLGEQQMILNSHKYFQKTLKDPSRAVKTTADTLKVIN